MVWNVFAPRLLFEASEFLVVTFFCFALLIINVSKNAVFSTLTAYLDDKVGSIWKCEEQNSRVENVLTLFLTVERKFLFMKASI